MLLDAASAQSEQQLTYVSMIKIWYHKMIKHNISSKSTHPDIFSEVSLTEVGHEMHCDLMYKEQEAPTKSNGVLFNKHYVILLFDK